MYERAAIRTVDPVPRPLPPQAEPEAPAQALIAPWEILDLLRANVAGIASAMAVCVLAALAFLLTAQPSYLASTQLIIDPVELRVTENSLRAPNAMSDTQVAQVEDDVRVMTSIDVLSRVVQSQNLAEDPDFAGAGPSGLSRALSDLLGRGTGPRQSPAEAALRSLAKAVTAKREERTYVVTVSVKASEAVKAARLADAVVSAFIQVQAENRSAATRRVADALGGRLDSLRRKLEESEQRVVDYKARHAIVAAVGASVTEQRLVAATARLGELRSQLANAQSRYAQAAAAAKSGDPGAVPEALQSPTIGGLRAQFTEAKRRESDLAATLGPRHPALNEARAQEGAVKAQVGAELGRIAATLKTNRDRVGADLAAAQSNYDRLEADVTTNSQLSVPLSELDRAAQADRAVYESTLARTRQVAEQERIDTANVSVISPAQVPDAKSWPPRPLYVLAAALILGFALGAGGTLGLELYDRRRGARGWAAFPA